jgi:hypothetical protein
MAGADSAADDTVTANAASTGMVCLSIAPSFLADDIIAIELDHTAK